MANNEANNVNANANADQNEDIDPVPVDATRTLRLQYFRGNEADTMTAENWIAKIDRARGRCGWTSLVTAQTAVDYLRENADDWQQTLWNSTEEDQNALKDWDAFKTAFLERFSRVRTASQRVYALNHLKQKRTEKVAQFADRVLLSIQEVTAASLNACQNDDIKRGYKRCCDDFTTWLFTAGMHAPLRQYLEKSTDETRTFRQLTAAAERAE